MPRKHQRSRRWAEVVQERCTLKGLTDKELAHEARLSTKTIERIFKEHIVPTPPHRVLIEKAVDIEPEESNELRRIDYADEAKSENQQGLAVRQTVAPRLNVTDSRRNLTTVLRDNEFEEEFINDVIVYDSEEVLPFNLRSLLTRFFRIVVEKSDLSIQNSRFSDNLKITRQIGCLTDNEVTQITRLYDLLTSAFEAPEDSLIDAAYLRDSVLRIILLVAERMRDNIVVNNRSSLSHIEDESFWAEQFVRDIRASRFDSLAFRREIDRDLMQAIRGLLRPNDVDLLFYIITDPTKSRGLRTNYASLIISRGTRYRNRQGIARIV